jgi:hypothetical protein
VDRQPLRPERRLPPPGLAPRQAVAAACELVGVDELRAWCTGLLAGDIGDADPGRPRIEWLGGTIGWPSYWPRVWGARGLLHAGPTDDTAALFGALADPAWRVREMALKVIARYELPDPEGAVDALVDDPVERVRAQAWRALGRPGAP